MAMLSLPLRAVPNLRRTTKFAQGNNLITAGLLLQLLQALVVLLEDLLASWRFFRKIVAQMAHVGQDDD
jgi:hypothetical protein